LFERENNTRERRRCTEGPGGGEGAGMAYQARRGGGEE